MGWFGKAARRAKGERGSPSETVESRIRLLGNLGIRLHGSVNLEQLANDNELAKLAGKSWEPLLLALCDFRQTDQGEVCLSGNVWHYDAEMIDGPQAYEELMQRLAQMAGGDLPLEDAICFFEEDDGAAHLNYSWRGQPIHQQLVLDGEWLDGDVFAKVNSLLREDGSPNQFYFWNSGGQDAVLLYSTTQAVSQLGQETGLVFKPV